MFQEAMFREQVLERKLESLNRLLQDTRKSSEAGWQAMLNEERLLRKLDLYESQLAIMKQDFPEDSLQAQLRQVLDEKCSLEKASELMLARILCEKTEALTKVTNLECRLSDSERECARLRQDCEATQEAYQSITTEHQSKMMELVRLEQQLQDIQTEKENLEALLRERTKEAEVLQENLAKKTKVSKPSSNLFLGELDKETNFALNGIDNGPFENPEHIGDRLSSINRQVRELRDKVDVTDQLQSSLNQRADLVRDEIALSDLTELDRYCELQERLATSEANFEQMLDSTSDGISMHLMDSVRQFHQSMQLIKSLQDELASLAQLKSTLSRELKQATADPIKSSRPPVENNDSRLPNQSDEVYPLIDEDVQEINDHGFSNTLNRARSITARVAACHARAEASLSSYCAEQRRQTDICNSSEDLRTARSEVETYKQMAETFKQQDVVKSDLLLSVREECDTLRKRIASIEADMITSREDHQRLIAEARRTRSEADELRQERDALNDQVNTCNQRIEQLQSALRTTLLGPMATPAANTITNSTSTAHRETDAQSTPISHPGTSSTAQPPVLLSPGPGSFSFCDHSDNGTSVCGHDIHILPVREVRSVRWIAPNIIVHPPDRPVYADFYFTLFEATKTLHVLNLGQVKESMGKINSLFYVGTFKFHIEIQLPYLLLKLEHIH
ncbi:hypothetical protein X801_01630 [Opisthorchis viverrini]|uniref:Uncharacterized protein n=1 Tax=Opisthorchis viverrini TaxID=6198 RepID=A0A1S8X6W5_OPIVI|nr:hypothetical protein X801_01630 [Opisthorchis viverrini]